MRGCWVVPPIADSNPGLSVVMELVQAVGVGAQAQLSYLSPAVLACTLAALFFGIAFQKWRHHYSVHVPPGSFGLPFLGETLDFLRTHRQNQPWKFFDARQRKHGDIFKTHLVGDPTVVASGPSGNKFLFTNENKLVNAAWPSSVITVLGHHSLIAKTGDEAKNMRQALMTFLRPEGLQKYMAKADRSARKHVERHWVGREQVVVYPTVKHFTFMLACSLFVSREDEQELGKLEVPFAAFMKGILQLPINLPGTRFHKAIAASDQLRQQFGEWIEERRKELKEGKVSADHDMLSLLLSYKDDAGAPLTDDEVKDNILLVLFGGHDTSTVTLTMLCKYLAENPQLCEEIWGEQEEIAVGKGPEEPLSWEDIQRMKLSWRAVQETLRLNSPAQGGFRVALREIELGGYTIPKGWKFYWTVNTTNRNPRFFPEPDKFNPARFEGSGPAPYSFTPFGGGLRMCPGNEFARMETLLLLHYLVRHFRWKLMFPDEEISIDPMPYPKKGLPIWLERRID